MQRWSAGGDEEACKEANEVADQIRDQAALDGITGPPCVEGPQLPDPARAADYKRACERYEELKEKCDG